MRDSFKPVMISSGLEAKRHDRLDLLNLFLFFKIPIAVSFLLFPFISFATEISDESLIGSVESMLGEYRYGNYVDDRKIGSWQVSISKKNMEGRAVYLFSEKESHGSETDKGRRTETTFCFDAESPFELRYYETATVIADREIGKTTLTRTDNGYEVKSIFCGEGKSTTVQVTDMHSTRIDDLKLDYYDVTTKQTGTKRVYNYKGITSRIFTPGANFYKLIPRCKPVEVKGKTGTLRHSTKRILAKCNRVIDNPEKVVSLKVGMPRMANVLFETGPGQHVTAEPIRYVIRIRKNENIEKATEEEIKEYLKSTKRFPAENADIVKLSKKVIEKADTLEKKVGAILFFVARYIEDTEIHRGQSVLETLIARRGDCTEHAELFVTIARSLGIPARTVGGLHYLGGHSKDFEGHMWCEVVINGNWISVDPTLPQFPIDALHIRFPTDEAQCHANMRRIQDMKIEILDVGYRNMDK